MKLQLFAIAAAGLIPACCLAGGKGDFRQAPMKAVYDRPAANWENEALPIGNGRIGAMIFGGVGKDVIQTNEKTLWSGGPGEDADYNGGHLRTPEENHATLQAFRKELQKRVSAFDNSAYEKSGDWRDARDYDNSGFYDNDWKEPKFLNNMLGTKEHFGSFQTLSEIVIEDPATGDKDPEYTGYTRELDLDNAVQNISYTSGGVNYTRSYFMSYPDNVMVVRLTADKPFSRKISVTTKHRDYDISADANTITYTGWPTPTDGKRLRENDNWRDCLKFAQQVAVHSTDGKCSTDGKTITVSDARNIVLVMSAATNYQMSFDDSFNYFSKESPLAKVEASIAAAKGKNYRKLLEVHEKDYRNLYARNSIRLGAADHVPSVTTDSLLRMYSAGKSDAAMNSYLETLYYQFGRYLLISSSRPGSLPANLQGIWGERLGNAWNADYHTNINIQMNYWPAEPTNLSECHQPMLEFVRSLEPRGTITARHYHCRPDGGDVRGWTAYHEINAWGNTAPAQKGTHSMFPEGAVWMCADIWESYRFNNDPTILAKYFDTMKNAALFWVDNLCEDERDGTLVANPSLSPEHGAFSLGCTASQGMIYEIFDAVEKAARVLGRENEGEIREIAAAKKRLSMPKIGKGGQFMEWKDEVRGDLTGDGQWNEAEGRFVNTHRHTNHLFWLHPGSQVVPGRSDSENRFVEAMKTTLNTRGDEGTGWSRAWKLNFWARLRDGDRAYKLLRSCLNLTRPGTKAGGVYANLFDAHPPFQIDGNFGFTSGVSEMLIQSQGDAIELLPALPSNWADGEFKGMCARGGFVVDAAWKGGRISEATVTSRTDNTCRIKLPEAAKAKVKGAGHKVIGNDMIEVAMKKGKSIKIEVPE